MLTDLRSAAKTLLPVFAETPRYRHRLKLGVIAPARYLVLPTEFEPLQLECHPLLSMPGHASCEVLDLLAETKTPVAALISVLPPLAGKRGIAATLASQGRRESIIDIYERNPRGRIWKRHHRMMRAPTRTGTGLLEASIDLGLRDLA